MNGEANFETVDSRAFEMIGPFITLPVVQKNWTLFDFMQL
jgi:hypothetical protein